MNNINLEEKNFIERRRVKLLKRRIDEKLVENYNLEQEMKVLEDKLDEIKLSINEKTKGQGNKLYLEERERNELQKKIDD